MSDERVLDKLSKLLELANRGDEHEAANAAARAAELMAKYEITEADIRARSSDAPSVEQGRIDAEDGARMSRIEKWHKLLFSAIAEACGARGFFHHQGKYATFHIIGPAGSVATASYMYASLERQINRISRQAQREHGEPSNAWRRSHAIGCVARVAERMRDARRVVMREATSTALVYIDKTKQAIEREYAQLKAKPMATRPQKRKDAMSIGYDDGSQVDIGDESAGRLGEGRKVLRS